LTRAFRFASLWNRKAAEQGHATAQYYLGREYYTGQGVEKDLAEAVKWFSKAAEQGNQDARWTLIMIEKDDEAPAKQP
jgi:uncharacterized protein